MTFFIPEEALEHTKAFTVSRAVRTTTTGKQTETQVDPLQYQNGQRVQLWYDANDALNSASLSDDDWRTVGGIILGVCVLFWELS